MFKNALKHPFKTAFKCLGSLVILLGVTAAVWAVVLPSSADYLYQSVEGQMQLLFEGRPVREMLNDDKVPAELKQQLLLVQEVKAFAEQELKLQPTQNYEKYLDLKRDYLVMVLTASPPLKMESKTWWFPIVGTVPYKGYFDLDMGKAEEAKLQAEGYETHFRASPAYSTLGWFNDPLLSTMMQYGEYYLVNTVIHESVHATHWVPGEVTFNENMASFIGDKGALKFYAHKYGQGSDKYKDAVQKLKDQKVFADFLRKVANQLKTVYDSDAFEANKVEQKAMVLATMKYQYAKNIVPQIKSAGYAGFEQKEWNNALLMSYLHYNTVQDKLEKIYNEYDQDIPKMMEFLKRGDVIQYFQDTTP